MGKGSVAKKKSILERNKFFETTNISGFSLIQSANSSAEAAVWYVVIFVFAVLTLLGLIKIIHEYHHQAPITTVHVDTWDGDLGDIFIRVPIIIPSAYQEFYHLGYYQHFKFPYPYYSNLTDDLDLAIAELNSKEKLIGKNAIWPYILWPLTARIAALMHDLEVSQKPPPWMHLPSTMEFIERFIDHCNKLNVTMGEIIDKLFDQVFEQNFYILSSDPVPHQLKSSDFHLVTFTATTHDSANAYIMGIRLKKNTNTVMSFNYLNLDYTSMVNLILNTGVFGNDSYSDAKAWYGKSLAKLEQQSLFIYKDFWQFKTGGNDLMRVGFVSKTWREVKTIYEYRSLDQICNKTSSKWKCYTECMSDNVTNTYHCQPLFFTKPFNDTLKECSLKEYSHLITTKVLNDTGCINTVDHCAFNNFDKCKSSKTAVLDESLTVVNKNQTVNGRTCQKWSSKSPHNHYWEELGDHNNCLNPDNDPGPWCYTVEASTRFELCYPTCEVKKACINTKEQCAKNNHVECISQTDSLGDDLTIVNKSVTVTGRKCQKWSSQYPHKHKWGQIGDNNNCHNPTNDPGPWCYTEDSGKRWELCYPNCKTEDNKNVHNELYCEEMCHQSCSKTVWSFDRSIRSDTHYYLSLQINFIRASEKYPIFVDIYPITNAIFLANLGGAFDLWIGASIISAVHLIVYITKQLFYAFNKDTKTGSNVRFMKSGLKSAHMMSVLTMGMTEKPIEQINSQNTSQKGDNALKQSDPQQELIEDCIFQQEMLKQEFNKRLSDIAKTIRQLQQDRSTDNIQENDSM